MPTPFEQPSDFDKGDKFRDPSFRQNLNKIVNIAQQQSMQPGQFQSGAYNVQRPKSTARRGIIAARVNEPGDVQDDDEQFEFDEAVAIVGVIPKSDGTGTAENVFEQEYVDDEMIILFEGDDGKWYTDRKGESEPFRLMRYEALEYKAWNTSICDAKLIDPNTGDDLGIDITLVDVAPSKHELNEGSRGWCFYKNTVSEVDHYYILTADSPARWIEGILAEEWTTASATGYMEVDPESTYWWGASPNNDYPVTEEYDFGDDDVRTVIVIHDTLGVRDTDLPIHTKVRCVWDEKRGFWLLEAAVVDDKRLYPVLFIEDVEPATSNIAGDDIDIIPGCAIDAGIIMIWNEDKSGYTASREDNTTDALPLKIAVLNWTGTTIRGALNAHAAMGWGRKVRFNWQDPEVTPGTLTMIDAIEIISNDDMRAMRNYNISEELAPYKAEGESDFELGASVCEVPEPSPEP